MRYLFFISWFRAREKQLVDQVDLDRMIGASSMDEAFKVFNDTDYALYLAGKTYLDIEKIIEEERDDFKKTLEKMGMEKEVVSFLFLKDDLCKVSRKAKEKIFKMQGGGGFQGKDIEEEALKEIEERKPKKPEEIDSITTDIYFEKSIKFLESSGERETGRFFGEYYEKIKESAEDLKRRDMILSEMEKSIVEESREKIEGMVPILSFFIKKRRVEQFIRAVFSAKKMGLASDKIYNLIEQRRVL